MKIEEAEITWTSIRVGYPLKENVRYFVKDCRGISPRYGSAEYNGYDFCEHAWIPNGSLFYQELMVTHWGETI
jgi:hypothetical protein